MPPDTDPAPPAARFPAVFDPPRRPGSVRRTTTHDLLRPEGVPGPVAVDARGRDLRTGADGEGTVLDAARIGVLVEMPGREIREIHADPPHPGLQGLAGTRIAAGYRRAVAAAVPDAVGSGRVRHQLLDDLAGAMVISGYANKGAGIAPPRLSAPAERADLCAGWATGGTLLTSLTSGRPRPVRFGPPVPADGTGDRLGWHEFDALPVHGMRRRRRVDVWTENGVGVVDCAFRDSYVGVGGAETVVHEYAVRARVDPATLEVLSSEAEPGTLPASECPAAAASAARLAGTPLTGVRRHVSREFTGTSTCTHLNDILRSLEDVGALLAAADPDPARRTT
ncbi:DUF2889 domain-containing protein [Actinomadura rugatobispora]|uniref:DUF2889 domain-containing protein n=1 Tax=Actinomadura rugatobispora TaxID=1994 RepID=A0ABW0ZZG1_9ACTN